MVFVSLNVGELWLLIVSFQTVQQVAQTKMWRKFTKSMKTNKVPIWGMLAGWASCMVHAGKL